MVLSILAIRSGIWRINERPRTTDGRKGLRILIAVAGKHGSTREIAEAIPDQLRRGEHDVDVVDVTEPAEVRKHDAVVIGSAVYLGRLMSEVMDFVTANRDILK